jgi:hypothetical protein
MKLIDTAMKLIATIAICAMICGIWTYTPEWAETNEANSGVPDQEEVAIEVEIDADGNEAESFSFESSAIGFAEWDMNRANEISICDSENCYDVDGGWISFKTPEGKTIECKISTAEATCRETTPPAPLDCETLCSERTGSEIVPEYRDSEDGTAAFYSVYRPIVEIDQACAALCRAINERN